jgi:hypothetical protein
MLPSAQRAARAQFPAAEISTGLVFECLPDNTIRTHFLWTPSQQGPQWLDLSLFDNGFALGTFLASGPMAAEQSTLTWDGLLPNAQHHVRVNTLTASGWFPSQTMTFSTPNDCPFPPVQPAPLTATVQCAGLTVVTLSGCVWTLRPDFATYVSGEIVHYCYFVSQPSFVRIVATKPDGTSLVVIEGFEGSSGACVGPFLAAPPFGLRTVVMYGGPDMRVLDETHFFVQ